MPKIYNFPTYSLPSGDATIVIKIFDFTDSETTFTEKYFSFIGTLKKQSELQGGDVMSDVLKLEVANDVDYFFSSTLYEKLVAGYKATLTLTIGEDVKFIGSIDYRSFNSDEWYATESDLSDSKRSVKFNAKWIVYALNDIFQPLSTRTIHIDDTGVDLKYMTFQDMFTNILAYLDTYFGLDASLVWTDASIKMISKDSTSVASRFISAIPTPVGSGIYWLKDCGVVESIYTPGQGTVQNYLFDPSQSPFIGMYDFLVGFIKSFGLLMKFSFPDDSTIVCTVLGRRDGSEFSGTPKVLEARREDTVMEYRDSVDVQSAVNGGAYRNNVNNKADSKFSFTSHFDLAGTYAASMFGVIVAPTLSADGKSADGTNLNLLQYLLDVTNQYIVNGTFETDMDGWTGINGTWAFYPDGSYYVSGGSMSLLANANNTTYSVETPLSETIFDSSLFYCWLYFSDPDALTTFRISFQWLNGSDILFTSTSKVLTNVQGWRFVADIYPRTDVSRYRNIFYQTGVNKLRIQISTSNHTPNLYIYFDNCQLFTVRDSTVSYLGLKIFKLFSSIGTQKIVRRFNGITPVEIADYLINSSKNYYFKTIETDFHKDETFIEAINYPLEVPLV